MGFHFFFWTIQLLGIPHDYGNPYMGIGDVVMIFHWFNQPRWGCIIDGCYVVILIDCRLRLLVHPYWYIQYTITNCTLKQFRLYFGLFFWWPPNHPPISDISGSQWSEVASDRSILHSQKLLSGKPTKSYRKWAIEIVDLPIFKLWFSIANCKRLPEGRSQKPPLY